MSESNKLDGLGNPLNIGDEVICLDYGFAPFKVRNFKYFKGVVHEFTPTLVRVQYYHTGSRAGQYGYTAVTPNVLIKTQAIQ